MYKDEHEADFNALLPENLNSRSELNIKKRA
jgi:hypothetical protein